MFATEADFETYMAGYFAEQGCTVTRQPWCNVWNDTGAKDGGRRRADLHVQFPTPVEGWLRSLVLELKLDGDTGKIRTGVKQTIAYMRAFAWRAGRSLHHPQWLPRPDIALFATPGLLKTRQVGPEWLYHERDLWDHGAALLTSHRGPVPGTKYRLIEKTHVLTGRYYGVGADEPPEPGSDFDADDDADDDEAAE